MSAFFGTKVAPLPTDASREFDTTNHTNVQQRPAPHDESRAATPSSRLSAPVPATSRLLPFTAPPDGLLRAAALSEVTANFSDCFYTPRGWGVDMRQLMASYWERSHAVEPVKGDARRPIDFFISHAWADARPLKFLNLSIWFNEAAFLFSLTVGLCLAVAFCRVRTVHPIAIFTAYLLVHYACYLHWRPPAKWLLQWLRCGSGPALAGNVVEQAPSLVGPLLSSCLYREPTLFVDRLCVHQTDSAKRKRAIEGLAGILSQCDSFIALWSDEYSDRLWCSFEVAVFLAIMVDASKIHFIPIKFGFLMLFLDVVVNLGNYAFIINSQQASTNLRGSLISMAILLLAYVSIWRVGRCNFVEVMSTHAKIPTFDVHRTVCAVEADRPILYHTLQHLFGNRFGDGEGGFLPWDDVVNQLIRTRVMLQTHPLSLFQFKFTLSIACSTFMRHVCIIIASFAATDLSDSDREQAPVMVTFALLHSAVYSFCSVPCIIFLFLLMCHYVTPLRVAQLCDGWLLDIIGGVLLQVSINFVVQFTLFLPSLYVFGSPDLKQSLQLFDGFILNYRVRGGAAEVAFRLFFLLAHVLFTVWLCRFKMHRHEWTRQLAHQHETAREASHELGIFSQLPPSSTTSAVPQQPPSPTTAAPQGAEPKKGTDAPSSDLTAAVELSKVSKACSLRSNEEGAL